MSTKRNRIISFLIEQSGYGGQDVSSHIIAKLCDCTPSYARKICKREFMAGRVCYREIPHQGRAKIKRLWRWITPVVRMGGSYIMPGCIQEELSL